MDTSVFSYSVMTWYVPWTKQKDSVTTPEEINWLTVITGRIILVRKKFTSILFIWFKSFHIVGIRRSYEDGMLISFHSCHPTTGYTDSKTPPNHRSNLVPTHSNTSAAKKQPFSVPSPSDPTRVAQFRDDSSAEALEPHERLNKLFERLEKGHVERLQDIGKAVKSFDRSVAHLEYKGPKLNSFEVVDVFYFI